MYTRKVILTRLKLLKPTTMEASPIVALSKNHIAAKRHSEISSH
jgi:hypothetical protein